MLVSAEEKKAESKPVEASEKKDKRGLFDLGHHGGFDGGHGLELSGGHDFGGHDFGGHDFGGHGGLELGHGGFGGHEEHGHIKHITIHKEVRKCFLLLV